MNKMRRSRIIRKIEYKNGGEAVFDMTAKVNETDYDVIYIRWLTNTGELLAACLPDDIDCIDFMESHLPMDAHREELRRVYATNKNGQRLISFYEIVDV